MMPKEFFIKENSCLAKWAAWKMNTPTIAIVVGRRIHLHGVNKKKFLSSEKWVRHELKHVQQFEQHGFIFFIAKYIWHIALHGYHNCCYEKEARAAETDDTLTAQYQLK